MLAMLDAFIDDKTSWKDRNFLSEKHFLQNVFLESNVIFSSMIDVADKELAKLKISHLGKHLYSLKMGIVHKSNISSGQLNCSILHINGHGKGKNS